MIKRSLSLILPILCVLVAVSVPLVLPLQTLEFVTEPTDVKLSRPLVGGKLIVQPLRLDNALLATTREFCVSPRFAVSTKRGTGEIELELRDGDERIVARTIAGESIRNNNYIPLCARIDRMAKPTLVIRGLTDKPKNPLSIQLVSDMRFGQISSSKAPVAVAMKLRYSVPPITVWASPGTGFFFTIVLVLFGTFIVVPAVAWGEDE